VKRFAYGLAVGVGLMASLAYAESGAGVYIPSQITTISGALFLKFGGSGDYASVKTDDFETGVKAYLNENHITITGANAAPGKPRSAGRIYLTFNEQTRTSCIDNANLALAQHQNRPSMFTIQVNDLPIDTASDIDESCKAPPHRLVIIMRPS
jgi:hypothetical protein